MVHTGVATAGYSVLPDGEYVHETTFAGSDSGPQFGAAGNQAVKRSWSTTDSGQFG